MDEKTLDIIMELGAAMHSQFREKPEEEGKDLMICQTFIMLDSARQLGLGNAAAMQTSEEAWVHAIKTIETSELGLDDSPHPGNQSMIDFVRLWSRNIEDNLRDDRP